MVFITLEDGGLPEAELPTGFFGSAVICSNWKGFFFLRKFISYQQRLSLEDCFFVSNVAVQISSRFV